MSMLFAAKSQKKPFKDALKALLEEYSATIGVDLEGDTHGVDTTFVVEIGRKTIVLNECSSYLSASDL